MSEERGFQVVDRRRRQEEPPAPGPGTADPAADPEAAPGNAEPPEDGAAGLLGEVTVAGLLQWTTGLLAERAWVGLGLVPDPISGKVARNLPEARRAIDVVADLVKHLCADATPQQQRELQAMVTDLRVNYVRQSGEG